LGEGFKWGDGSGEKVPLWVKKTMGTGEGSALLNCPSVWEGRAEKEVWGGNNLPYSGIEKLALIEPHEVAASEPLSNFFSENKDT